MTNILLTMIAAKDPLRTTLTTIACMEGDYHDYGRECFPFGTPDKCKRQRKHMVDGWVVESADSVNMLF